MLSKSYDFLSRKVSKHFRNAPILVFNQVCDWVHDGVNMNVGMDLVKSCLVLNGLNSREDNLAFSISSLDELDIVYTIRVFQSRSPVYIGLPVLDAK